MNLGGLNKAAADKPVSVEASAPTVSDFKLLRASTLEINFDVQQRMGYGEEDIKEFAESIKANRGAGGGVAGTGYEQPINVWYDSVTKKYLVTFGGRRTMAGQCKEVWGDEDPFIPALVSKELDKQKAALASIIENEDRLPPTPMEQTNSYMRLFTDFGMSVEQIATSRGWSISTVNEILNRSGYGPDLRQMMQQRPDTKRIAREIHTKIGEKDPAKRAELIEMVLGGASWEKTKTVIDAWVDQRKTEEAIKAAEARAAAERRTEGSTTSKSKVLRSSGTGGITFNRSEAPTSQLPAVEFKILASNLTFYTRQALTVCQKVQPNGKPKKELTEATKGAIENLENLLKILRAGTAKEEDAQAQE